MHDWNAECPPPWGEADRTEREEVIVITDQARLMRYHIHFASDKERDAARKLGVIVPKA